MSIGLARPIRWAWRRRRVWPAASARCASAIPTSIWKDTFTTIAASALINSLEAVKQGMRYINTTLLGIAERSGITSMTALLFNLYIDREFDKLEGYHLRGSYPINVLAADKLKMLVPPKEPVSLTNRTHTAGVHQNAVLNDASTYEAHPLDLFGVSETEILLGPLSGWNIIHYFLKEIRYFEIDEATAKEIAGVFKERVYQTGAGYFAGASAARYCRERIRSGALESAEGALRRSCSGWIRRTPTPVNGIHLKPAEVS